MANDPCQMDQLVFDPLKLRVMGQEIRAAVGQAPDVCELINKMMGQFFSASPQLLAILGIIDCILKAKDVLVSIPDAIMSLDPSLITDAIGELLDCIGTNILPRLPQMWIPTLIYDILALLLQVMDCLIATLNNIASMQAQAEAYKGSGRDRGSAALAALGVCVEDDAAYYVEGLKQGPFGAITILFAIISSMGDLVVSALGGEGAAKDAFGIDPGDPWPFPLTLPDMTGQSAGAIVDLLESLKRDVIQPLYDVMDQVLS